MKKVLLVLGFVMIAITSTNAQEIVSSKVLKAKTALQANLMVQMIETEIGKAQFKQSKGNITTFYWAFKDEGVRLSKIDVGFKDGEYFLLTRDYLLGLSQFSKDQINDVISDMISNNSTENEILDFKFGVLDKLANDIK